MPFLMETSALLLTSRLARRLRGAPRELDTRADGLSSGLTLRVDPAEEIKVDVEKAPFLLRPEILVHGAGLYDFIPTRLKVTEPWQGPHADAFGRQDFPLHEDNSWAHLQVRCPHMLVH